MSGDPFGRAPRAQVVTRSDIKMKHACLSVAVASATVLGLFGLVSCGSESPPPAAGSGGAGSCGDSSPCSSGDGCCPTACTDANDADCSQSCVELTAGTCTPGDGCCPSGCNAVSDNDCSMAPASGGAGSGGAGSGGAAASGGTLGSGASSGSGGDTQSGGTSGVGGSPVVIDCDESAISSSPSTASVDASGAHPIAREIFGVLLEDLGRNVREGVFVGPGSSVPNTDGVRNDLIEGFKEAGVGAIQWPGGCHAAHYDWQAELSTTNNLNTDTFMEFSLAVGAEPFLVGRAETQYAQSNGDWLEYVNDNPEHPEWHVKYFKVGNEVWGCGGDLTAYSQYEPIYEATYNAIAPDSHPKDLFMVAGTAGIWTINAGDPNGWIQQMLSPGAIVDQVDGIEIHDYIYFPDVADGGIYATGFSDDDYYDIVHRANRGQIEPRIEAVKSILDDADPSGRIKIIEDEWGDWLEGDHPDGWFQKGTLMDAISAAEHLHVFMKHGDRVQMGGLAQSTNVIHSLFATNSPSSAELVKTPTFYVFKMFVPHHENGARFAPASLEIEDITGNGQTFPVISFAATVNEAGQVHVSLVNVDLENTRDITVSIDATELGYSISNAEIITGSEKDSYNEFGEPESVNLQPFDAAGYDFCAKTLRVTLPPKSIVAFSFQPLGAGGGSAATGCPAGDPAPSGDCSAWSTENTPELCTYAETQCYCQAGQQGATWRCEVCPETPPQDGAECSVTEMICGACSCELNFLPGGQRAWTWACGG